MTSDRRHRFRTFCMLYFWDRDRDRLHYLKWPSKVTQGHWRCHSSTDHIRLPTVEVHYVGLTHVCTWASMLSVLGPLNVRLSWPERNSVKPLMQFLEKKREICTIQYHNELSVLQMSPNAFICHWSLSLLVAWSEFNMFWITRVLMKTVNTRSRDITEQCQLMIDMLAVVHQVFMRKTRFLLRFR